MSFSVYFAFNGFVKTCGRLYVGEMELYAAFAAAVTHISTSVLLHNLLFIIVVMRIFLEYAQVTSYPCHLFQFCIGNCNIPVQIVPHQI